LNDEVNRAPTNPRTWSVGKAVYQYQRRDIHVLRIVDEDCHMTCVSPSLHHRTIGYTVAMTTSLPNHQQLPHHHFNILLSSLRTTSHASTA